MKTSESITEISPALIKLQSEIQNVLNTSNNPFFKSKYAPLDEILNYVRPIITRHGLSIIQSPISTTDVPVSVGVTTRIIHSSGEWIEDSVSVPILPVEGKDKNGNPKQTNYSQEAGIIITYLRRYSITAFLGIAGAEDTDGNRSDDKKPDDKKTEEPKKDTYQEALNYINLVDTQEKADKLTDWINKKFTGENQIKLLQILEKHSEQMKAQDGN